MENKIIRSVALGAATMALIACGDDITQEINQSQGLESYAAINELPDCTSENEGEMAFVSKEAKVYYCADSSWQLLNGEDGENGKDGVDGTDGKDGTNGKDGEKGVAGKDGLNGKNGVNGTNGIDGESCTIEELNEQNGYKVICGGDSVGVLLNGAQGAQGAQGEKGNAGKDGADGATGAAGTSCTAEALEGNSGYKIVCGGDSIGVVLNGAQGAQGLQGEKGEKGDTGKNGVNGTNGIDGTSCTAVALEDNSGYKIVCGGDSVGVVLNGAQGPQGEKGDQGLKGDTGAKGDQGNTGAIGAAGTSCTAEVLEGNSGYKIVCGGDSVGVVLNGAKGEKGDTGAKGDQGNTGAIGAAGTSCTAEVLEGNSGYKIVCGGDSVGVVLNGAKGEKGDTGAKGDKGADGAKGETGATGANGTSCTVVALEDNSGYKIVCGSDSVNVCGRYIYDPNKNEECHNGAIYFRDTRVGAGNKLYKTVTIGTQIWMAENLNYETENSYCYNDNTSNCDTYGRLYTWAAAMGKSEEECGYGKECNVTIFPHQGICPAGYHLPSDAEWNVLLNFVLADNDLGETNKAGTYLKSTTGWNTYSGIPAGTDKYGFKGLSAGYRSSDESYTYMGIESRFWSSTEDSSTNTNAFNYNLGFGVEDLHLYSSIKTSARSVRCVRD